MPTHFHDESGRTIMLRGVNLADGKFPPGQPTYKLSSLDTHAKVSYLGSPLSLQDAPAQLARLRYLGFNVLRLPVVWEALEHAGPGAYDDEYIAHAVSLVRLCNDHGFRVIVNPHQDLWSRFAGGSGAPLWTLHACGLDPDSFADTHAAVRYAEWPTDSDNTTHGGRGKDKNPHAIPDMMWTSNHNRLAPLTLFALFFAGRDFAPRCKIDGVNIQDYLQNHYMAAYGRLADALGGLEFGWDSMNEPEPGLVGWKDLGRMEREASATIGSTPSPIEAMKLGMGIEQTVDRFKLGKTGPHKSGTVTVTPGRTCWMKREDVRWKWDRSDGWKLGECVWAQHGVWDVETGELKRPQYFDHPPPGSFEGARSTGEPFDWKATYWRAFYEKWNAEIRRHSPTTMMFFQSSVFDPPPHNLLSDITSHGDHEHMAYSPHFYDALTIMKGHWHTYWNIDIISLLRGPQDMSNKLKALRVGSGKVRQVISDQLGELANDVKGGAEGEKSHPVPTLIGETGIPFDLDGGKAYRDGDYTSQVAALDAIVSGCDKHLLNYTLWAYSPSNTQEWGDHWNGEDLSIYCAETGSFPSHKYLSGFRAAAGWCRPYVQSISPGTRLVRMDFDLKTARFRVEVEAVESGDVVVYVPWLHYRRSDEEDGLEVKADVSAGEWVLHNEAQLLHWTYQQGGKLSLQFTRASGTLSPKELGTLVQR
ncbi:putative glycoside hydrolase family 5 [Diaporthe ampelina]|uniref:Putative glycoside hydrolase family 5 n=1 Tax=Diaporthe ampelina TaxID=1214573 RepID=A0A0G2IE70_9PEZI|nr:putative glycoside hydrolase family 5 [Diaporthe ampelina]